MNRPFLIPVLVAGLVVSAAPGMTAPGDTVEDCVVGRAAVNAALTVRDPVAVENAVNAVAVDTRCSSDTQQFVARHGARMVAKWGADLPPEGRGAALRSALKIAASAPPWEVLAQMGRLAYDAGDFAVARYRFEQALNDLDTAPEIPRPPTTSVIAAITRIHTLAAQARMLARSPAPSPPTVEGRPGGLTLETVRGFRPVRAPVPITFPTDEWVFTEDGASQAALLRDELRRKGDPAITLVGHTDPKGPPGREDAHNCELSWKRVEATRRYLEAAGYPAAHITVHAMGLRQPLAIIDRERLNPDQINQILRRVEFFTADDRPEVADACPRR